MDLGLKDKVAVISGASKGIGFATAELFAREGLKVVVCARTEATLNEAAAQLERIAPGNIFAFCGDMTLEANAKKVIAEAIRVFGSADIAISNAGALDVDRDNGQGPAFFDGTPPEDFQSEFRMIGLSAWYLAHAALPHMKAKKWGRIINVASSSAREPKWELPHVLHCTVRPATAGLHRSLAYRLYPQGITVNSVLTGSIGTARWKAYHEFIAKERGVTFEALIKERFAAIPVGRPGTPEEMAGLIAFFSSTKASHITGQSIPVAGGRNRHVY